jgi:hypothetical protein
MDLELYTLCGWVFLYPEGDTPDTTILLGVIMRLYRLLGQPVVGSSGFLDSESMSMCQRVSRLHRRVS